jgi:hypothetical protein
LVLLDLSTTSAIYNLEAGALSERADRFKIAAVQELQQIVSQLDPGNLPAGRQGDQVVEKRICGCRMVISLSFLAREANSSLLGQTKSEQKNYLFISVLMGICREKCRYRLSLNICMTDPAGTWVLVP